MTPAEKADRITAIRCAVEGGMTRIEASIVLGLSYGIVAKACGGLRKDNARARANPKHKGRALRMVEMYRAGLTLQQLGTRYGVSRERARQILAKHGIVRADGGQSKRAASKQALRAAKREANSQRRWGCSHAEYIAIRAVAAAQFKSHWNSASARGIKFTLTLKQWWDLWQESGHWHERGRGANKYCMSRVSDDGGYEFGNVYFTTGRENGQEYQLRKDRKRSTPVRGVWLMYPGLSRPYSARYNKTRLGNFATIEEAAAARDSYMASRKAA